MSNILFNVLRSSIHRTLYNESLKACYQLRLISVSTNLCTKPPSNPTTTTQKRSKEIPKITLIQQNQAVSVTSLDEAQKLARRRDLKLIKIQDVDPKSHRPVYKLATAAELLKDDFEEPTPEKSSAKSHTKRTEKSLTINSRISDNDLSSRLKNIGKWLSKGNEVRIVIQGGHDDGKGAENVLKQIETSIKEPEIIGKITQKRNKDNYIKFNIIPDSKKVAKEAGTGSA